MKIKNTHILLALIVVFLNFFSFMIGMYYGVITKDPLFMAEQFHKGKTTFCELNEDARMFACPVMRRSVLLSGNYIAILYTCDIQRKTGFVSFLGKAEPEIKTQALMRLIGIGLKTGPHCENNNEEIVWIKKEPWKTAAIQ